MIKRFVEYIVLLIKGREIKFDDSVKSIDLFFILLQQSLSMTRGIIRLRQLVLLGSRIQINSKYNLNLSKGVTIGSHSLLDALGVDGLSIGSGSSIGAFSIIKVSGTLTSIGKGISIGSNVGIGDFAHIGGAGGVSIGDDTIAGAYLSIHPENHVFTTEGELIRNQGVTRQGVSVGKNCWIGAKVTLLDGSVIGNGSVVAAGAVVRGAFPDNVVIGGVPAKILKEINHVK